MANITPTPTATQPTPTDFGTTLIVTVTECWSVSTSDGTVFSTPVEPTATGAECYLVYPYDGGVIMSPIPSSGLASVPTQDPVFPSTAASSSTSHSIVGPVVGSVVGFLVLAALLIFYLTRRRRHHKATKKRSWAMAPGKWVTDERKPSPEGGFELTKAETDTHA